MPSSAKPRNPLGSSSNAEPAKREWHWKSAATTFAGKERPKTANAKLPPTYPKNREGHKSANSLGPWETTTPSHYDETELLARVNGLIQEVIDHFNGWTPEARNELAARLRVSVEEAEQAFMNFAGSRSRLSQNPSQHSLRLVRAWIRRDLRHS